jgi:hypothetical protein
VPELLVPKLNCFGGSAMVSNGLAEAEGSLSRSRSRVNEEERPGSKLQASAGDGEGVGGERVRWLVKQQDALFAVCAKLQSTRPTQGVSEFTAQEPWHQNTEFEFNQLMF